MIKFCSNLRLVALAVLIVLGLGAERVLAAESETLTVAGGCFWCVESDFEQVRGVLSAVSGYTGGDSASAKYKTVSSGKTSHYEAVQITFDPDRVSRETLLNLFLRSIDPTDETGQFCDRGKSYRSAIFVSNNAEKALAESAIRQAQKALGQNIVTPVLAIKPFYAAEDYHQDYYKGTKTVLTRFGPLKQHKAYKRYRESCGRDARVRALWGSDAAFAR